MCQKKISKHGVIREGTCARIARTFPGLNLYNNSLSKVVDTHDLVSAWLSLWYFYLVVFFSLFSLSARTTKR